MQELNHLQKEALAGPQNQVVVVAAPQPQMSESGAALILPPCFASS